jgi:hypothetical protein
VAERHPHGSPVEGVGAAVVERDRTGAEGSRVAVERTEVLVVVDPLGGEHQPRGRQADVAHAGRGSARDRGQHPPVQVEAHHLAQDLLVGDHHRDIERFEAIGEAVGGAGSRAMLRTSQAGRPRRRSSARCPSTTKWSPARST